MKTSRSEDQPNIFLDLYVMGCVFYCFVWSLPWYMAPAPLQDLLGTTAMPNNKIKIRNQDHKSISAQLQVLFYVYLLVSYLAETSVS